jgi:hypothetical protein
MKCRSGQTLIESCIVIILLCLILSGFFQISQVYLAKEISAHACFRGARAKTVGFNDFMVNKTIRVGTIANAGQMTFPDVAGGPIEQMAVERGRIPIYLGAEGDYMLDSILQYEDWDTVACSYIDMGGASLPFRLSQDLPLRYFPVFFRAFYRGDSIPLDTDLELDYHASLYLQ